MVDVTLLLVPLLVLPLVLLFRFIGCAQIAGLDDSDPVVAPAPPPAYRDYIMSDPDATAPGTVRAHPEVRPNRNDVIAYWRLVDPEKIPVPTSPDRRTDSPAVDEKGFQNGTYVRATFAGEAPSPAAPGGEESAPAAANAFSFGNPSLIVTDPLKSCRGFNGGYVVVPSTNGLYPAQFTIEAWVWPQWGGNRDLGYEHTLFSGRFGAPSDPAPHGFAVVADRTGHWQVRFDATDLFASPPLSTKATHTAKSHIAVAFAREGSQTRVRLFLNGKEVQPASNLIAYAAPAAGSLWIGVAPKPAGSASTVHRPLIGLVQEVVLHRKALSAAEIANHVDINRVG